MCADADKLCARELSLPVGSESSVEVRGNFTPDGWVKGVPMTKQGSSWKATLDLPWGASVQYKFVIDGSTWIADPTNPNQVDDGVGGVNSVAVAEMCSSFSCGPEPALRFAVVGDFGASALGANENQQESAVATLIAGWSPELIVTVGDNNYPDGTAATIDQNIGQYYHAFIAPYAGTYGQGASTNQFFPCLGNHDWNSGNVQPYTDYFALPGNERYWEHAAGPVHFFCIDSEPQEPDGNTAGSTQGQWLQQQLGAASEPFRIVLMHRPPYSSGMHHSTDWMQWPYAQWGANVVMAGHDHDYERLSIGGVPYIVDGIGGAESYEFTQILPESQARFSGGFGAVLAEVAADKKTIRFQAVTSDRLIVDNYALTLP